MNLKRLFKMILNLTFVLLTIIIFYSCSEDHEKFSNPILMGFYPDPSICRVGEDYYLVNSTFAYYPGIPVFHSKDLINWECIGYVLDRPEQLNLDGLQVSRGIFAPAIRFNNGMFYVTCTLVDRGGNFVVRSKNPAGPWSDITWLPTVNGIDPSLFFDDNGKAYIIYNSDAPENKPLYSGHRTIRIVEFCTDSMKVISNNNIIVNGGVDISKKPVWIEGPHIFKKDGLYYLSAAEGGTAEDHSQVIFRSEEVMGPYLPYDKNPVLTQRNLDPGRPNPITSTGHADFVTTTDGEWWAVFLGCRPYPPYGANNYNTGRETFLAPVKWIDGWPVINPDNVEVQYFYSTPFCGTKLRPDNHYSGNFELSDNFTSGSLSRDWAFLRTPVENWYNIDPVKGNLTLNLRPETCAGNGNPSFLGHRQQHQISSASVSMEFNALYSNEKAGLLIFQNEEHYYSLCKTLKNNLPFIMLLKSGKKDDGEISEDVLAEKSIQSGVAGIFLKIESDGGKYSFYFSEIPGKWELLKDNVDGTFLSTKTSGGFVGSMYALYATSSGYKSDNEVVYNWFSYKGDDIIYRKQ